LKTCATKTFLQFESLSEHKQTFVSKEFRRAVPVLHGFLFSIKKPAAIKMTFFLDGGRKVMHQGGFFASLLPARPSRPELI